jgi:uncharacterized membrane protein
MNASRRRWLLEQLPQWEREGLVSPGAARTLHERYAVDPAQPGLAQLVLGALGALLIGVGLISVIGYNWDDFSRPVRLLFAFLPLLLTQLFSMRVLQRENAFPAWVRETAAILQTLAVGACIALVSQVYNLGGEWPDFLFWWFLLSLPLVWTLRSHAAAIFYLIAIAVWSVNQADGGNPWHDSPAIYPLLLLGLLPYWPGWPRRVPSSLTVRWFMALSAIVGLASAAVFVAAQKGEYFGSHFNSYFVLWTLTAAALVLFPLHPAGIAESTGRKPQVVLGTLFLLGYGIGGTFRDVSSDMVAGMLQAVHRPWCWGLLAVLAGFAMLAARSRRYAVLAIASVALLPLIALPFVRDQDPPHSGWLFWLFILHLSAVGITLIVLDLTGRRGAPRLGALLLAAVLIARMSDSEFSLLAKGLAFIVVGVAFLAFLISLGRLRRAHLHTPTLTPP